VARELEFTGWISPVEEVPLYFKTGGFVKRVLVQPGDQVRTGDLLAELEIGDLQTTSAELNLALAQARLAQAEQANDYAITQAEMALIVAQEQLSRTIALQATYAAETTRARVGLEQAEDEVARAQTEYQEAIHRYWDPPEVHEAYTRALQQAQWELEIAQALFDQAIANEQVYRRDLRIAEIGVNQIEVELEQLKQGVDPILVIEVQQAQQVLDYSQIVAPIYGKVASLSLYPGRAVEPFRAVIVIAAPSAIEVSASLSDDQMQHITEGQEAAVVLNANPDHSWTGTVRLLPYPYGTGGSDESQVGADGSTRISLDGDLGELELGDLVQVTIVLEEKDDVLWLPPDAIRSYQGRHFVIVQEGDRQRRVDVEIGIEGQDRAEILRGLEEGQMIVAQ